MLLAASIPTGHELAQALITGALLGGLYAITALGLSLVFGVMRLINLVHGELVVLGAYLAYELTKNGGFDPLLALVLVAPALFLLAAPVQRWVLEPLMDKGPEPALLTTFGLSVIAQNGQTPREVFTRLLASEEAAFMGDWSAFRVPS